MEPDAIREVLQIAERYLKYDHDALSEFHQILAKFLLRIENPWRSTGRLFWAVMGRRLANQALSISERKNGTLPYPKKHPGQRRYGKTRTLMIPMSQLRPCVEGDEHDPARNPEQPDRSGPPYDEWREKLKKELPGLRPSWRRAIITRMEGRKPDRPSDVARLYEAIKFLRGD